MPQPTSLIRALSMLGLLMAVGCATPSATDNSAKAPSSTPTTAPAVAAPAAPAMEYAEVPVRGRIYVVGAKGSAGKAQAGELPEMTVTKIGYGPAGETVVFEANKDHVEKQLMQEFDKRHPQK